MARLCSQDRILQQFADPGQAAATLGPDERGARPLLARFGRWSPYS
ncbi:hypothetical protein [Streptomyces sp. NPDC002769]